jgi:limonene-1,2-epoxide hydrolase
MSSAAEPRGDSAIPVVRALIDAAYSLDAEGVLEQLDDAVTWNSPPLPTFHGKHSVGRALRVLFRIVRSLDYRDDTWSESESRVFVERVELLQFGPFEVELPGVSVFQVEDGRVIAWRDYYDPVAFPLRFMKAVARRIAPGTGRSR